MNIVCQTRPSSTPYMPRVKHDPFMRQTYLFICAILATYLRCDITCGVCERGDARVMTRSHV